MIILKGFINNILPLYFNYGDYFTIPFTIDYNFMKAQNPS